MWRGGSRRCRDHRTSASSRCRGDAAHAGMLWLRLHQRRGTWLRARPVAEPVRRSAAAAFAAMSAKRVLCRPSAGCRLVHSTTSRPSSAAVPSFGCCWHPGGLALDRTRASRSCCRPTSGSLSRSTAPGRRSLRHSPSAERRAAGAHIQVASVFGGLPLYVPGGSGARSLSRRHSRRRSDGARLASFRWPRHRIRCSHSPRSRRRSGCCCLAPSSTTRRSSCGIWPSRTPFIGLLLASVLPRRLAYAVLAVQACRRSSA